MIDANTKASAIARIKCHVPLEEISADLDIPVVILKDWRRKMGMNDLVAIEANNYALSTVLEGTVDQTKEAKLKEKLLDAALKIVDETAKNITFGDPVYSKSLQLNADTLAKLHATFIAKSSGSDASGEMSDEGISLFSSLMKD